MSHLKRVFLVGLICPAGHGKVKCQTVFKAYAKYSATIHESDSLNRITVRSNDNLLLEKGDLGA
jgi:hypothetical protein